ncbi:hypothetical protein CBM2589_B190102 [Cupriavidus taiwanensis]|uniref:Uncharacterized protein n=1 Tax=Cupriavidus taiwanensis TaxID=164546 RepID=A0A975ZZQ0_9BURK|nr:hypothetical protein CBM2589_B190102 [Cupriavidus taiwanensis]
MRLKQAVEAATAPGAVDMLPVCRFSRPAAGNSGNKGPDNAVILVQRFNALKCLFSMAARDLPNRRAGRWWVPCNALMRAGVPDAYGVRVE